MRFFVYANGLVIPARKIEDVERFKLKVTAATYKRETVTLGDLYPPQGVFLSDWQLEQLAIKDRRAEERKQRISAVNSSDLVPSLMQEGNRQAWVNREYAFCRDQYSRRSNQRDLGFLLADIILESKIMNAADDNPFPFGVPEMRSKQAFAQDIPLAGQSGIVFEKNIAELCKLLGYEVQLTASGADQGVDLVLTGDDIRIAVQAKHYSGSVGNSAVQEVHAGKIFYSCRKGVVVTNSSFTKSAIELARKCRVVLVDGQSLDNLRYKVPYQPFGK